MIPSASHQRGMIFVDGSALFARIVDQWRKSPSLKGHRLKLNTYTANLLDSWVGYCGSITRCNYYFRKRDKRIGEYLSIPDVSKSGAKSHWKLIECGQPVPTIPEAQLEKLDPKYRDSFARAEKGLDTRLTCDAMMVAVTGRVDNLVFFVYDRDFVPVLEALQSLGCNTYLTGLGEPPSSDLLDVCDAFKYPRFDPTVFFEKEATPSP